MRTIIIGDIHGCYDELHLMLEKVGYNSSDRLIFVGDVINKGPKSIQCLEFVEKNNVEVVRGNHEERFLELVSKKESFSQSSKNSLQDLILEMGDDLKRWVRLIESWPYYIDGEDFTVVHAGLEPGVSELEKMKKRVLTHIRTWDGAGRDLKNSENPAWFDFYQDKKLVVYGHWAILGLHERENVIGLDSGCVYGKQLSALILPTRKIVQVEALKTYCSIY